MTRNQQPLLHFPPQTVHTNPPRPTKTTQTRHYRSRPWEDDEPQYQRGNGGYRNPSKKLNDVLSHSEPVRYSSKHPNFPPNTQYMTPNERRLADLEEQLRPYHGVEFPDPAPKPPTPPTRIGNYQDSPTRFKPYPQYKSGFAPEPPPIENHASHNSAYEPTGTKFDNAPSYHQDGGGYQQYRANRNAQYSQHYGKSPTYSNPEDRRGGGGQIIQHIQVTDQSFLEHYQNTSREYNLNLLAENRPSLYREFLHVGEEGSSPLALTSAQEAEIQQFSKFPRYQALLANQKQKFNENFLNSTQHGVKETYEHVQKAQSGKIDMNLQNEKWKRDLPDFEEFVTVEPGARNAVSKSQREQFDRYMGGAKVEEIKAKMIQKEFRIKNEQQSKAKLQNESEDNMTDLKKQAEEVPSIDALFFQFEKRMKQRR